MPLRFVITARRLLFFWTILHKPEHELVKQTFRAQQILPVKNDWWLKVCEDLNEHEIELSELEISNMKKNTFKRIVNSKLRESSRKYLGQLKDKHSKSSGLQSYKLQTYLTTNELTTNEKQLLFQLRTRTFNCKANFKSQYGDNLSCLLCDAEDNQSHLLLCSRTTVGVSLDGIAYNDIFGTIEKQVKVTKALSKVTRNRKILLENSSILGSQAHL